MTPIYLEGRYIIIAPGHPASNYDYGADAFGYKIADQCHHWHPCRDKVQGINKALLQAGFIFTHKLGVGPNIAAFLSRVETILDLPERTVFRQTDLEKALWMRLSPFWLTSFMRRSFLTMVLRCGARYDRNADNFSEALKSISYARDTEPAIQRFFAGFTHYVGAATTDMSMGWHRVFLSKDEAFARQYLKAGHELTAKRAYFLYLNRARNGTPGDADTDWQQAVAQLAKE